MSEQHSHWKYVGKAGDESTFNLQYRVTYKMTDEAERERDASVMAYLRKAGEHFKGPFAMDPVALCELWAQAWMAGHGDGHRKARLEHAGAQEVAKLSAKRGKKK